MKAVPGLGLDRTPERHPVRLPPLVMPRMGVVASAHSCSEATSHTSKGSAPRIAVESLPVYAGRPTIHQLDTGIT